MKVTYDMIHRVVSRIPRGRVATYGQIADLAGIPGQARRVGYALSALPDDTAVPWQRVVNAKGEISLRSQSGSESAQQKLLRSEGVLFSRDGRILMDRFQWRPRA
ncbi:MAG TPA: MGMT family protein [Terriglobia bacterium]|nr:MGMT family protein [Terriglobia bacterium]